MSMLAWGIDAVEHGLVPDVFVRRAIRRLCRRRLTEHQHLADDEQKTRRSEFLSELSSGPLALVPEKANEQHYEVPAAFFDLVLGPHRKYSSCYWSAETGSLETAESNALQITCDRAELCDGQDVLELGCGWGSLSLWMAERFPLSRITSVSNSASQREFIEAHASCRGLGNLKIVTADMNSFVAEPHRFDRVVSVEMFEHMHNFRLLLERISTWLKPDGFLFSHHFCHRQYAYPFESRGEADWMSKYFFSGGIMPDEHLLDAFSDHMQVANQWSWDGKHYQKTAEAWLANMDRNRAEVMKVLTETYGRRDAHRWFCRWRMFFLAVSELFGATNGTEWFVTHVLMRRA